jgi:hydrogenase expression/formation protein HypC
MCLGIPGRVTELRDEGGLAMGKVDFGGVRKDACLAYLPDVKVGDYVIVHVGFAISRVDEDEAQKTLEILDGMGVLAPELQTFGPGMDAPAIVSDDAPGALTFDPAQPSGPTPGPAA